jgi:uncharacterized membrane protein
MENACQEVFEIFFARAERSALALLYCVVAYEFINLVPLKVDSAIGTVATHQFLDGVFAANGVIAIM